jgi:hypothetical protein
MIPDWHTRSGADRVALGWIDDTWISGEFPAKLPLPAEQLHGVTSGWVVNRVLPTSNTTKNTVGFSYIADAG